MNYGGYAKDAPIDMFGSADFSVSKKIHDMAHEVQQGFLDQETFLNESEELMLKAAKRNNILMVKTNDCIILKKTEMSYINKDYCVYDIFWNETKSGINAHEHELAGIWNIGNSSYSVYIIHKHKQEREIPFKIYWRDKQINSLLDD